MRLIYPDLRLRALRTPPLKKLKAQLTEKIILIRPILWSKFDDCWSKIYDFWSNLHFCDRYSLIYLSKWPKFDQKSQNFDQTRSNFDQKSSIFDEQCITKSDTHDRTYISKNHNKPPIFELNYNISFFSFWFEKEIPLNLRYVHFKTLNLVQNRDIRVGLPPISYEMTIFYQCNETMFVWECA